MLSYMPDFISLGLVLAKQFKEFGENINGVEIKGQDLGAYVCQCSLNFLIILSQNFGYLRGIHLSESEDL